MNLPHPFGGLLGDISTCPGAERKGQEVKEAEAESEMTRKLSRDNERQRASEEENERESARARARIIFEREIRGACTDDDS